jgi:hypothetical protein
MSDGELHFGKPERSAVVTSMTMTSTPHSYVRPQSAGEAGKSTPKLNRSLPDMPDAHNGTFFSAAANVYPIHLLQTTNYRLPGDVDSQNLERHLTDADFESVFRMSREDFYQIPYWKRCDMKRRHLLF